MLGYSVLIDNLLCNSVVLDKNPLKIAIFGSNLYKKGTVLANPKMKSKFFKKKISF